MGVSVTRQITVWVTENLIALTHWPTGNSPHTHSHTPVFDCSTTVAHSFVLRLLWHIVQNNTVFPSSSLVTMTTAQVACYVALCKGFGVTVFKSIQIKSAVNGKILDQILVRLLVTGKIAPVHSSSNYLAGSLFQASWRTWHILLYLLSSHLLQEHLLLIT